jgi:homoserine O-acetyltransferase
MACWRTCGSGTGRPESSNADGSNAILFPTWFGGTSGQLLGVWSPWIDTDRFFLVIVDALGNGVSTSPSNSAAQPGQSFPQIGIRTWSTRSTAC